MRLPKSTRTIHRLLRENGRIASRLPRLTDPIERPKPMEHWQLDFKDASTVPADPHGKRQQVCCRSMARYKRPRYERKQYRDLEQIRSGHYSAAQARSHVVDDAETYQNRSGQQGGSAR